LSKPDMAIYNYFSKRIMVKEALGKLGTLTPGR